MFLCMFAVFHTYFHTYRPVGGWNRSEKEKAEMCVYIYIWLPSDITISLNIPETEVNQEWGSSHSKTPSVYIIHTQSNTKAVWKLMR